MTSLWRVAGQFLSFAEAVSRWVAAGRPVPAAEELARRETACRSCPHHDGNLDGCRKCGCGLVGGSLALKRSMGTEQCPDDPPRW